MGEKIKSCALVSDKALLKDNKYLNELRKKLDGEKYCVSNEYQNKIIKDDKMIIK